MTLTKKFGAILFLFALGSLVGVVAFASFFVGTARDGLYLVAAQLEIGMLQEVEINTLKIRGGEDEARAIQSKLIEGLDVLIATMANGGKTPVRPLVLLTRIPANGSDKAIEDTIRAMQAGMPAPPEDLKVKIRDVQSLWIAIKQPVLTIAEEPAEDPEARAAYETIRTKIDALDAASRVVLIAVGERIIAARERMLATLGSLAGLSFALFALGLWFTKRYISRPIALVETAALRIRGGDFSQRVPVATNDELASLATAMNEMCAEIERSLERYRELFENASDLIFTIDLDGNFRSVNRAGERMSGFSRDELLTMNVREVVPHEQLEKSRGMLDRKLSGEQSTTVYPMQMMTKDGRTVSVEISARLIYENGKPIGIQGMARDITERRRLEEQLWTAQKMEAVGRLAGGIAHEFGNVLTIITGYSALLLGNLKNGDPLRDEAEGIQRAAQRAGSLIRHLLGFSKGQVFRPKVLDLREKIPQIADMLLRLVGEDIQLTAICDPDVGAVRFDPAQLEQVLVNLTLNARDAMPGGGELTICAANGDLTEKTANGSEVVPPGSYVRLTVADTGSGMSRDVLARMFEPFFSTKERGTGLGLSTVFGIVHQSAGSIGAESEVGRGTTFTIFLPRLQHASAAGTKDEAVARVRTGTETVLLVEDEGDVRFLVREMLRSYGYNVIAARDQWQAIQICSQPEPKIHLLLTDVVMPGISGPELAGRVRPYRPDMRVLYMSGHTQDKFESYIEKEEPVDFIQKPLAPEILAAKVREVLDSSRNGSHG